MAVEQKKILMRRGNKADLALTELQPGEIVLALDTNEVGIKTSGGVVLWFATSGSGTNKAVLASEKDVASGIPILDANKKVVEDPASYGKADGGAILPHTLPTAASLVKLLNGTLSVAVEGTDYFTPHEATVTIGSGWASTLYLSKIGHIVVCLWVSTGTPYISNEWTTLPGATIPAGFIPATEMEESRYVTLGSVVCQFKFKTDGTIQIVAASAVNTPYFNPGSFVWTAN